MKTQTSTQAMRLTDLVLSGIKSILQGYELSKGS